MDSDITGDVVRLQQLDECLNDVFVLATHTINKQESFLTPEERFAYIKEGIELIKERVLIALAR